MYSFIITDEFYWENQFNTLSHQLMWLTHLYVVIQEEVMAEESTDGEVETQVYNQDSQDSIGEVSKHT